MADEEIATLRLGDLVQGIKPGVTPLVGGSMAEAACVCLFLNGHPPECLICLDGDVKRTYRLAWDRPTLEACNCHADEVRAVEDAAYGLSFLTVLDVTKYTILKKSRRGTGVDWFLAFKGEAFQGAARLEVSGIMRGTIAQLNYRVEQKLQQSEQSDAMCLPAYVSVTEFGTPRTRLVKRA